MSNLKKYIDQKTINDFKKKGITFEPYIERYYCTQWNGKKLETKLIDETKHSDVWLIKKPQVKSRKALNEQCLAEIVSANGYFFDSPEAKYVIDAERGIRFASNDYLGCYYASTISELIHDYNQDIVFDPNNKM